jgi:hypothetical protein
LAVLLLPLPFLAVAPTAAHASATPWAFTTIVTSNTPIGAASVGSATAACPTNYLPTGGGMSNYYSYNVERLSEYVTGQSYTVNIHNKSASTSWVEVQVNCVLASNPSTTYIYDTFARNATTGLAGGVVRCPTGSRAITGGADWSSSGITGGWTCSPRPATVPAGMPLDSAPTPAPTSSSRPTA